jgi:Ca-activated chloride channel family protein
MTMFGVTFAYPLAFALLALIPVILWWYYRGQRQANSSLLFSRFDILGSYTKTTKERLQHLPLILRCLVVACISIALARPQSFSSNQDVYTEGIDIAIALDLSGSMLATDFKPNRIEAAKKLTADFIDARKNDKIGLVIFSREAFTQCPLTVDYKVLKSQLAEVKNGMVEDGTAIGNALANCINRLRDSTVKSKVVILLTDGVNNAGEIDPLTASELAKVYGVRVYTIGIGTMGQAPYPVQTPMGITYQMMPVEIDEALLKKIATETGGKYYRATGNDKLTEIFTEIDGLEKSRISSTSYRHKKELYYPWAAAALLLLFGEILLGRIYLRKLP